ncbi:hypothetical protein [Microbacterium sp. YY-01]|uniref:hypothetical protein n=1 Tax=Microbacterium sp. YY-01 TaxID=3421634 RepID=UPI003D1748D6
MSIDPSLRRLRKTDADAVHAAFASNADMAGRGEVSCGGGRRGLGVDGLWT